MNQILAETELKQFCRDYVKTFKPRQLVLLSGPLGAGKTHFVKKCVEALGGDMPDSPTFSLINEYSGGQAPIWHVDLYRLTSSDDIESIGFWDLFREPAGTIFVEWPERVPKESWPLTWPRIELEISFAEKNDERVFSFS